MNASPPLQYHKQKGAMALLGIYSLLPLIMIVLFLLDFGLQRISAMQVQLAADSCALAGASALANTSVSEAKTIANQLCQNPPIAATVTNVYSTVSHCDNPTASSGTQHSATQGANCILISITAKLLSIGFHSLHSLTTTSAAMTYPQPSDPEMPRISRAFLIPSIVNTV